MGDPVLIRPRHAVADVDRDRRGHELGTAHRHAGVGGHGGARERDESDPGRHREHETRHTIASMTTAAGPYAALEGQAARVGLRLSETQLGQCEAYGTALIEANRSVNLTAITDPSAVAIKHFLDSFTAYAARAWSGHERLVDVGSGAGFPGLALRIAVPGLVLTCVEATGKKARAIEAFAKELAIPVEVAAGRAEELGREARFRARYDVATARALGSLAHCAELLFPFLRVGGDAIVWKGRVDAELPAAERALAAIGGQVAAVLATSSLGLGDELPGRHLVVMRKTRATPDRYPRTPTEMKRRPW